MKPKDFHSRHHYHLEPFRLGICLCGCNAPITIATTHNRLSRFRYGHRLPKHRQKEWNGGKTVHTRDYIYIYAPDHPFTTKRKYVYEHRLVMERHLGRYLTKNEVVHHINGNHKDNRIENLKLIPNNSIHLRNHHDEYKKNVQGKRVCSDCGNDKTYFSERGNFYLWGRDPRDKTKWLCNKCVCKIRNHMRRAT